MLNFGMIAAGFASVMTLQGLFYIALGTFVGIIFGAVPGLSGSVAIALFIPVTYTLEPNISIALIMGLMMGGVSGGLISAILLNIPGTAASFGTTFDGHPMAMRGEAGKALGTGIVFSFIGGLLSMFCLILIAPTMAKFALKFGTWEYFTIAVFALTMVASLSGKNMVKGLISGCFGFVIAMVGIAPVDFTPRFTFGVTELQGGFALISVLTGSFALGEVMKNAKKSRDTTKVEVSSYKIKGFGFSMKEFITQLPNCIRSAIIGIVVGIIPGTGGDVASYVSHNTGRMFSKEEDFGHGAREGVACCEAANNAVTGGTLIPTLTLGVPGNATTAVLLSGLTIHGLTPGYGLFTTEKQITYPFICALFIANLMMVLIGMFGAKHFAKVTLTPKNILSAFVLSLSIMGTYAVRGNLRDVVVMLVFGVIGYILKLYKYNVVPIVLGLILGPIAEAGLSQALLLNSNSLSATLGTLFVRPICVVLMILMVISVCAPFIMEARKGKQSK